MTTGRLSSTLRSPTRIIDSSSLVDPPSAINSTDQEKDEGNKLKVRALLKRMRIQIWAGTITGFVIALAIGAAFIAVVRRSRSI